MEKLGNNEILGEIGKGEGVKTIRAEETRWEMGREEKCK